MGTSFLKTVLLLKLTLEIIIVALKIQFFGTSSPNIAIYKLLKNSSWEEDGSWQVENESIELAFCINLLSIQGKIQLLLEANYSAAAQTLETKSKGVTCD